MRIIVFGDSIAAGAFDTEKLGWVSRLTMHQHKRIVASKWNDGDSVINVSVAGHTSTDVLQRLPGELESRQWKDEPMTALLAIGTNDSAIVGEGNDVPLDVFAGNVQEIINHLDAGCENVFLVGLTAVCESLSDPWCYEPTVSWRNDEIIRYDQKLQTIASENSLPFVPVFDLFSTKDDQHLPDGLHPNAAGHQLLYERVKAALENERVL